MVASYKTIDLSWTITKSSLLTLMTLSRWNDQSKISKILNQLSSTYPSLLERKFSPRSISDSLSLLRIQGFVKRYKRSTRNTSLMSFPRDSWYRLLKMESSRPLLREMKLQRRISWLWTQMIKKRLRFSNGCMTRKTSGMHCTIQMSLHADSYFRKGSRELWH